MTLVLAQVREGYISKGYKLTQMSSFLNKANLLLIYVRSEKLQYEKKRRKPEHELGTIIIPT